jgi:hypothetical protein
MSRTICAANACIQAPGRFRHQLGKCIFVAGCWYTSARAILVDRCLYSCSCFSREGCAPNACIQAPVRFAWIVRYALTTVSQDVVVHQIFV